MDTVCTSSGAMIIVCVCVCGVCVCSSSTVMGGTMEPSTQRG